MENPYKNLEDYHFWRRAVAGVERFRFDPVVKTRFTIEPEQRVATAGSCFAQHISRHIARAGFNYFVTESGDDLDENERNRLGYGVFSARYGNIYTSRQLVQLFQESLGERTPAVRAWEREDGRYVDALRPHITPEGHASSDDVVAARAEHLTKVREMFENCDIFVFTLGLTETWRNREDGTVFPLAPGVSGGSFDPTAHEFVNLDVLEVLEDMETFLTGLKSINPDVKVILTVSPVPLIATHESQNVLVATSYSKSVLRVAADMMYRRFTDWVEYFPSYEIITGNYNNSAYYEADYRGINAIGVAHAMRCFLKHYTGQGDVDGASESAPFADAPVDVDVVCDEEAIDKIRI